MSDGFSVVIPAFNYGYCLERAVTSAVSQDYPEFEVIVINDGSEDDTAEVADRLAARWPERVRVVHQANAGLSAVRNRGIAEAGFSWLVFLDADDEFCPGALAAMAAAADAAPDARLVVGGHIADDGVRRTLVAPAVVSADRAETLRAFLGKRLTISNGACAMHRALFRTTHYDPALRHTEDLPVFAHVLANYPITTTDRPITVIHKHPGSMRHDLDAALCVGMALEAAIFDDNGLPTWAQRFRRYYRARRALSLLKLADRGDRPDLVRRFFASALGADWRQALHPRYLRRYVVSFFKRNRSGA
ncbi:MAG TPA: glycosyltransferase family A protein [Alcanivorax sp.]|nr:glycosyltransferase family A protein [Alcanivorax sp.]